MKGLSVTQETENKTKLNAKHYAYQKKIAAIVQQRKMLHVSEPFAIMLSILDKQNY